LAVGVDGHSCFIGTGFNSGGFAAARSAPRRCSHSGWPKSVRRESYPGAERGPGASGPPVKGFHWSITPVGQRDSIRGIGVVGRDGQGLVWGLDAAPGDSADRLNRCWCRAPHFCCAARWCCGCCRCCCH
jgi:hypothetical protein